MADRPGVPHVLDTLAAWSWRVLAVVAAVGLAGFVLIELRLVFLPLIVALFLSSLLVPPTNWLRARRFRPALATGVVFLGSVAVVAAVMSVVVPAVGRELGALDTVVRDGASDVIAWLGSGPLGLERADIDAFIENANERLRTNASEIAARVIEGALTAVEVIAGILLTVVLTFFFVKDGTRIGMGIASVFPQSQRVHVLEAGARAWATLGAYLRGIAIIATVDALAIGVGLTIIGVPLVLPLALLVFIGAFLPLIGAFIAGTVAALVALVTGGVVKALLVVVLILIVQQIEGHVLTPYVLSRATRLHAVVVILALTAGAVVAGVVGAFLSVPVAAVIAAILAYAREVNAREAPAALPEPEPSELEPAPDEHPAAG